MKRKPTGRNTAVFDFDEGDVEPYITKRSKFLDFFSKGKQFSDTPKENAQNTFKDKKQRLMHQGNMIIKQMSASPSSSESDKIETDDSDSESNQARSQLDTRFGGAHYVSSSGFLADKNSVAEGSKEVVMHGGELCFSDKKYSSPDFIFTTDAIELRTQAFGAVKLPLLQIKNFRSGSDERGRPFIELNLTKHGVGVFLQHLGHSDSCCSSDTIFSTISDIDSWTEHIKQITSLSDGYKSLWRPWRENVKHHFEDNVNVIGRDREVVDKETLPTDCIMKDRNRTRVDDWCDLVYPTEDDRDAVTVTRYDYLLLDPDQFLSDTIIDFYIKYIQSQLSEDDKRRFYFYNSFFFRKLTDVDKNLQNGIEKSKAAFERVKRWTAKINILDKDYLFIPIMQNAHWSLVIICHPGNLSAGCSGAGDFMAPVILHLDSLEGCHTCVEEPIRSYLLEEWRERKGHTEHYEVLPTLRFVALKVPQQTNYSDCGLFLLHYVELFIEEVLQESTDFASYEWFNPADVSRKRAHIQSLIQDLKAIHCSKQQHFTDTYVVRSSDIVQGPVSLGCDDSDMNKSVENSSGNLFDKASSMLVSHLQHHNNDMQPNACTRLGHKDIELGCVEVEGEPHQLIFHYYPHASCDELGTFFFLQKGTEFNNVQRILMPVQDNRLVQSQDYLSLDGPISDGDREVSLANISGTNSSLAECTARFMNSSIKPDVDEKNCTSNSSPNGTVNAKGGVPSCHHHNERRIFGGISSEGKSLLDAVSFRHANHKRSAIDNCPTYESGRLCEGTNSTVKVVHRKSEDQPIDSAGDACVWMEDKETLGKDFKDAITQHSADDDYQEVGVCMEITTAELINDVTAANIPSEGKFLQNKQCTSVPVVMEGGISVSRMESTDCIVSESSQMNETGLDGPRYASSTKGIQDGKSEKVSQRRNKQCELPHTVRRITRSTSKAKSSA